MEVLMVPAEPEEPDGLEVVRKTASHPDELDRLLREAEVLRAAAERGVPGVPAMITAPSTRRDEACLVTAAVAGPSLAVAAPLPVVEVAGVAAEVARLLAGLHEAGLVHGSVGPSHVVLDSAGGAILVGLGGGGAVGAASPDPADGPLDPAADVAAWGALVSHLLDWSAAGEDEPLVALRRSLADRRPRRGTARPVADRAGEHERRVLAALADQAQDPDPARRPSARSLAAAVSHRIPDARVPGAVAFAPPVRTTGLLDRLAPHVVAAGVEHGVDTGPAAAHGDGHLATPSGPPAARRRRRPLTRARAATPPAAADSSVLGVTPPAVTGRSGGSEGPPPPAPGSPRPTGRRQAHSSPASLLVPSVRKAPDPLEEKLDTASSTGAAIGARAATRRPGSRHWLAPVAATALVVALVMVADVRRPGSRRAAPATPPPVGCASAASPAADVDGDGCEEPVAWAEGILQAGSARFALGEPGDAWAVGDWDCDGRRTPALLHQGTLAVFDTWPGPGAQLPGRLVATATGATGLTVVPGADGCDHPFVLPAGAAVIPVKARSP